MFNVSLDVVEDFGVVVAAVVGDVVVVEPVAAVGSLVAVVPVPSGTHFSPLCV